MTRFNGRTLAFLFTIILVSFASGADRTEKRMRTEEEITGSPATDHHNVPDNGNAYVTPIQRQITVPTPNRILGPQPSPGLEEFTVTTNERFDVANVDQHLLSHQMMITTNDGPMKINPAHTQSISGYIINGLANNLRSLPLTTIQTICSHQITEDIIKITAEKLIEISYVLLTEPRDSRDHSLPRMILNLPNMISFNLADQNIVIHIIKLTSHVISTLPNQRLKINSGTISLDRGYFSSDIFITMLANVKQFHTQRDAFATGIITILVSFVGLYTGISFEFVKEHLKTTLQTFGFVVKNCVEVITKVAKAKMVQSMSFEMDTSNIVAYRASFKALYAWNPVFNFPNSDTRTQATSPHLPKCLTYSRILLADDSPCKNRTLLMQTLPSKVQGYCSGHTTTRGGSCQRSSQPRSRKRTSTAPGVHHSQLHQVHERKRASCNSYDRITSPTLPQLTKTPPRFHPPTFYHVLHSPFVPHTLHITKTRSINISNTVQEALAVAPAAPVSSPHISPLTRAWDVSFARHRTRISQLIWRPKHGKPLLDCGDVEGNPGPVNEIKIITQNIRGAKTHATDIGKILEEYQPHITILTETHMNSKQNRKFKQLYSKSNLTLYSSSRHTTARNRGRNATLPSREAIDEANKASGVTIIVTKEISAICILNENDLSGHLCHLTLTLPNYDCIHVIGIYNPASMTTEADSIRSRIANYLQDLCSKHEHVILGGDVNAALLPSDRSGTRSQKDNNWAELMLNCKLDTVHGPRTHTFHGPGNSSKIDDFLCSKALLDNMKQTSACTHDPIGSGLDHIAVVAQLDLEAMGTILPAITTKKFVASLKKPMKCAELLKYKDECTANLGSEIERFQQEIDRVSTSLYSKEEMTQSIEELDATLIGLLETSLDIAHHTCSMTEPPNLNNNPFCLPKAMKAKWQHHVTRAKLLRDAVFAHSNNLDIPPELATTFPELDKSDETWLQKLEKLYKEERYKQNLVTRTHRKTKETRDARNFSKALQTDKKRAHKSIYDPVKSAELTALLHEERVVTAADDILVALAAQYSKHNQPAIIEEHEVAPWLPDHPLQQTSPLDPFTPSRRQSDPASLGTEFTHKLFLESLAEMNNNRSEGPDNFPTELLKYAPEPFKHAIYNMFRLCYDNAYIPVSWKKSTTVLIYKKKGSTTQLENYRPIGLLRAIYKTYTHCLTKLINSRCESEGSLSESQEGFRKHRNCERQILVLQSLIADSHASGQNLHVTYIDFKDAFGSISHQRLPESLKLAGLPQDMIDAVLNVYDNATTQIQIPAGRTSPITFLRGVIQGDVLSPTIFNLFIEPLLKWLDQGKQGYEPTCLKYKVNSCGYADDLALINRSAEAAQKQLDKIQRFCTWAGMDLSVSKCAHSSLIHGKPNLKSYQTARTELGIHCNESQKKMTSAVQWKGTALPFLEPHETYKYLGVHLSLKLQTNTQLNTLTARIAEKIEKVILSRAQGSDLIMIIRETIMPCIEHVLAAALLSPSDVDKLQTKLNQAYRSAMGIGKTTSGEMITMPSELNGLGVTPIMERYSDITSRTINRIINDTSLPGQLGRASLLQGLALIGNSPPNASLLDFNRVKSPWIRKLAILKHNNMIHLLHLPQNFITLEKDNILTNLESVATSAHHIHHVSKLWAINIFTTDQLICDSTNKLITPEIFANHFKKATAAYNYIYKHLTTKIDPLRSPAVLSQSQTSEQTGTSSRGRKKFHYIKPEDRSITGLRNLPKNKARPYTQAPCERPLSDNQFEAIITESNPDHDIIATGSVELYKSDSHCYIYRHDGRLAGMLPKHKTMELWDRFQLATQSPTEEIASLSPKTFPTELLLLLDRYAKGERTEKGDHSPAKNHRTLPDSLYVAIQQELRCNTELLASPLDVSRHFANYYSCYSRDKLFGAQHDAYSTPWTGCNLVNPEYTPEAAQEAISWAVKSCSTNEIPCLLVMFVPSWPDKKTNDWFTHPMVQTLTTIPKTRLPYRLSTFSDLGSKAQPYIDNLDTRVIVIGNNAGLQTYFSQEASSSLALAILQAGKDSKTNTPCNWIQQPFNEIVPHTAPRTIHLSGKFKKAAHLVSVDQLLAELKTRPNKPYEPLQKAIPDLKPVSNRHLKWGNTTIHYTDGSAKDGLAGAGVVVSAAPMTANHRTKIPLGRGSSLMAELAGIYHALNSYDRNSPIHVASDCLTAITAIRNGIRDPTTIPSHKEETILRKCISAVKTRPAKTTILKVKAHIGIWGNTEADLAANDGRRLNTTETVEITDLTHSEKIFVSSRTEAAPIKPTEIHEIMKLNTASRLADIEYAKCNSASALNSNTTSSIAFKWSDATISGDILAPSDYGFDKVRLEKTSFRAYCRGKVMQQDRRHGKLCKLPGCNKIIRSPFHACGGCDNPLQKGKIQDEANKLTHKIAKAVQRGTLGKYTLLINAGTKHAVSGKEDATIPTWMLPGTYGCRNFPDKIDIVLIEGWVSGDPQPTPQSDVVLTIVEATSCHDYHIPNTVNHKRSKYVELVIALQQEGWTVKLSGIPPDQWDSWYRKYNFVSSSTYKDLTPSTTSTIPSPIHTIVIGHCGTHSPSNIAALLALGINKNSIHTVLRELSTQAVYRLGACQASYNKLERSPD